MASEETNIHLHQKEEKSLIQRAKERILGKKEGVPKQSDRFSQLGYIRYPQVESTELRITELSLILEDVEKALKEMEMLKGKKKRYAKQAENIAKLFRAFMTIGSPYMRGLDNRELAHKVSVFFGIMSMIGHLPAFYPDIRLCVLTLLHLAWQSIDVITQPPVLFETRATMQPVGIEIQRGSEKV